MLIERGYKKVRPLAGGLDAWIDAGYEVEVFEKAPLLHGGEWIAAAPREQARRLPGRPAAPVRVSAAPLRRNRRRGVGQPFV